MVNWNWNKTLNIYIIIIILYLSILWQSKYLKMVILWYQWANSTKTHIGSQAEILICKKPHWSTAHPFTNLRINAGSRHAGEKIETAVWCMCSLFTMTSYPSRLYLTLLIFSHTGKMAFYVACYVYDLVRQHKTCFMLPGTCMT